MSFVLVSPSQEIALKVVSIVSLSIFFKIDDDKFASVNTNPNVVAILGNMKNESIEITVDIGMGKKNFTSYTMDLTKDYVEINADYRS